MADFSDVETELSGGRSLTRQKGPELPFFTPSSLSFNPKPYMPHPSGSQALSRLKSTATLPAPRESISSALQVDQKLPDVSTQDPDATFIRYPFTSFPNSELHPEGLTYNILAELPDCFLDPADFRTDTDNDTKKITYPQILEPPRGWCPIRKKGPNDRHVNGSEEDVPKLRCTFCRRSYAGVNAKSMWRRHVLEKHKIPMSNRRDGPHEGGGRGRSSSSANSMFISHHQFHVCLTVTTEENRKTPMVLSQGNDDSSPLLSNVRPPKLKSAFSSNAILGTSKGNRAFGTNLPLEPAFSERPPSVARLEPPLDLLSKRSKSAGPELAPNEDKAISSLEPSPVNLGQMLPPSSPLEESSHMSWRPVSGTSSPTSTPSFGKKVQSRNPWKFPSPSHPLHSGEDDLMLGVPVAGVTGEGLRSSYVALQASPFPIAGNSQSQFSSPIAGSPLCSKPVIGRVTGWKRAKSKSKSKLPPLPDPSPRRPAYSGPFPATSSDALAATPELSFSTDTDTSFESIEPMTAESFSKWFDMTSPLKSKGNGNSTSSFPDTPIRRSNSSSNLEQLQLVFGHDDDQEGRPVSTMPIGLGLGFKFELTTSYGAKRPRHDSEKAKSADDSGLFGSSGGMKAPSQIDRTDSRTSARDGSTPASPPHSDDEDSQEADLVIDDFLPLKRRRLFSD